MRAEAMQRAVGHVESDDAAALAVFHDQVEREILDEETRLVLERLLIQGMQHGVAGAIRRGAGALRDALAEMRGHAAERPLVDAAVLGARERHAVVLELDDRGRRLLAHELDGVLVAQPIRTLHGVVHMPAPVVVAHVAERRRDAALRRDRMAAGREHLGQARGGKPGLGQAEGRAQSRAAGADDDHIVGVVDEFVFAHGLKIRTRRARSQICPRRPTMTYRNRSNNSDSRFTPAAVHVVFDHHGGSQVGVIGQHGHQQHAPESCSSGAASHTRTVP